MDSTTTFAYNYTSFPWGDLFPYIFCGVLLVFSRKYLTKILDGVVVRLKNGSSIKIGSIELDGIKVSGNGVASIDKTHFFVTTDKGKRDGERNKIYNNLRQCMVVHRIFKSSKEGQLFDVLIYLVPHKNSNLIQVKSVEYYFGSWWNNNIYCSTSRHNGYAIATSAYGPFMCYVTINFNDGESVSTHRYIDFEMGDVASLLN